jgi:prefoldin alpha subunit
MAGNSTPEDQHAALLRMLEATARQRSERRAELEKLQRAADDYESLEHTLRELPARVEHSVLVPFGKLAFFPGKLRHTNEVMVLLGDNYFALRSAEQAAAIAARRAEYVRPQVAAAQADVDTLTTRINQIRAYGETMDIQPGTFEIREPYCSDDEDADNGPGAHMPMFDDDDDDDDDDDIVAAARGDNATRAVPQDSDDDTDDEADAPRHSLPPLAPRPPQPRGVLSSGIARQKKSVTFGEPSGGSAHGEAAEAHASRVVPPKPPTKSSADKPVAAPVEAFGELVVERSVSAPPSDIDIEMREVAREAARRKVLRAQREEAFGRCEEEVIEAAQQEEEQIEHAPVSRFKAARMKARQQ